MTAPAPLRIDRLRKQMADHSLDSMVILHIQNIRYLTAFTGSTGVLVVTPGVATLYVDARYAEQAPKQVIGATCIEAPRPVLPYVLDKVKGDANRVGFEANHLSFAEYEMLQERLPDISLIGLRDAVEKQRAIKDVDELALMRRAIKIADDVFDAFCSWIRPGMVEDHVAARLEYEQRMPGGEKNASGVTIVASGSRTSLPHGVASEKVIGENEPVMIDIGTVIGGYCSDLTRTVQLGKTSAEFKRIYGIVYDAQQAALEGIRAGITGIEADKLSRDVIEKAGYGDRFGHSLGHSIGFDVHERPLLNPWDDCVLEENMIFTVEPGIYLPGWGGVRIEDMVRVTGDGCDVLTNSTRELLEL